MKSQSMWLGVLVLVAAVITLIIVANCGPKETPVARLRERISIDARDDAYIYNGADLAFYLNDHVSQTMRIDGAIGAVRIAAPTTVATATPVVVIDSDGLGIILEVRDAATPVWSVSDGGLVTASGAQTSTAPFMVDGASDVEQLVAQGYTTQTNSIFVVENSAGTDIFEVTTSGGNLNNNPLLNVGAAGTDFGSDGSLTTAQTITVTAGGLVVSAGGVTLSDGDAVIADDLRVTAQTAITVTNGAAFTPTGTYQGLQVDAGSSEVTPTLGMLGTAGDLLVLINTTTPTISIEDSGTTMLSAEWEAGQYDTLTLWCDGTNWLEISRSNN